MPEIKGEEPIKKVVVAAQQAARSESEPPRVRRYRAVLLQGTLALVAIAFGLLTFAVKTTPSFAFDLQATKSLQLINAPAFALFMNMISWSGFTPQSYIITGLIILFIYISGLRWEAVVAVIAVSLSTGIDVLIKDLIQRPRPLPSQVGVFAILNSYSFPSGHVMYYLGFFGFIWFLVFSLMKPSLKRGFLLVFFGALIVLIGFSRVYLGEHWASDVIGSYLLGTLTLVATIQIYRWGKTRFFVHQPVAPADNQKA